MQRFQYPYVIIEVPEVVEFLKHLLEQSNKHDIQDLYEISLELEPREKERRTSEGASVMLSPTKPSDDPKTVEKKLSQLERVGFL